MGDRVKEYQDEVERLLVERKKLKSRIAELEGSHKEPPVILYD